MSPSIRTMGFFMSEINFCNTKEQITHWGEVVTGKVDGSPSGADIDTSTLPYTGQVRKTLPALEQEYLEAIQGAGGVSIGTWASGVTTFTKYNEYAVYSGIPYKPRTSATLPYVAQGADPTAAPDDASVQPYQEVTESQVVSIIDATIPNLVPALTDPLISVVSSGTTSNPISSGDTVPSGVGALYVNTGVKIEVLFWWDNGLDFTSSSHVISSIAPNEFNGFNVVTNNGTFEFISDVVRSDRENKQLYGWCDMSDLSDITLAMEKALAHSPRLKIETKDGLERELKISFNKTYTPVSGNSYPYGVELPTDTDITYQKNILISTDETSGIMFPIAVGGSYVRPRMKLKGNGSSNNDVNNLLFGVATHIDTSFVMKMYSNIYVDYCEFVGGFNIDIDLRSVSGWKLRSNIHRGSIFSRADGAVAGYQQHVASCDDGERTGNRHYSGGLDRHAFYLATAQSGKNNGCHSHHNYHEWDNTDHTYSPYMSAINCRPTDSLSIDHEIINGSWGSGISFTTDSANTFTNLVVDHNQITNIGVKQPENASAIPGLYGAGISARISVSGGYAFGSIDNNVIILRDSPDDTLCLGIVLNGIDLASNDNVIKLSGDNQYGIGFQLACDGITSHDEKIAGNGFDNQSPYLLMGATALTNCLIGPHKTKGFKAGNPTIATNGAFTVPSGTLIDYELAFTITTDGSGGVTYTDTSGSISSATLGSEGISIAFNAMVKPNELNSQATALSANIGNIFALKSSSTVQFVPRDYSGSALNPNSVALSMDVKLTRKGS